MITALLLCIASTHVVVDVTGVPAPPPLAPVTASPPEAVEAAKKLYATRCALCHGFAGQGDGPSAGGLPVKPRRHPDALWQASVTDDDLAAVILGGGSAKKLSILMPPNPDLKDKPDVVRALVAVIRSLRANNGTARATITGGAKPVTSSGDADATGAAHIVFDAPPGTYAFVVDGAAGPLCRVDGVVVAAAELHVACPPAPPSQPRKKP